MRFDVPKMVRGMSLGEYAPEMGEVVVQVWVNPPRVVLERHDAMIARLEELVRQGLLQAGEDGPGQVRQVRREMCEVFAELWSAGPEGTRWTAEEVDELVTGLADTDPGLWAWMRVRTIEMIREHRANVKKN